MRRFIATLVATVVGLVALTACASSGTSAGLVSVGAGLQGPEGTTATVYTRGLKNVAALAFDADGRLWATTAAYDDQGNDRLYLIAKRGADPVVVLSGLHTPLGLLWYRGSLYIASRHRVDAYGNFDGRRFRSHRTIVTLPAGAGESNELVLAPDGRMLLGVSAACDHCTTTVKDSAAIISFKPDGSDLEVYASRIRAAVGLTYYPGTSDLFVTMNQRDDLGAATPGDWLAVVRNGDDWDFPACYGQTASACTGVRHPTAVLDRHSAVSGVAIVTGQLGSRVGSAALVAEWVDGKVQRVALSKSGSTYTGTVHPFLTGLTSPVPVIVGPAGTVLVGDWATGVVYSIASS